MSAGDASSSSTEVVAGFDIQRRLGERTWEAVQTGLGRRVALRRLEPDEAFEPGRWPERHGVVDLYAVVPGPAATYVATQFVPGSRTLAELRGTRRPTRVRWLDEAAAILEGTVHGRLTEHDILVGGDGRVRVTWFGRAVPGARSEDDRAALEALLPPPRAVGRVVALGAIGAVVGVAAVGAVGLGGDPSPAPRVLPGATSLGSRLAAGDLQTVDCNGDAAGGQADTCTIMQLDLNGRPLVAPFDGLIRRWVVRGASGTVSLVVLLPSAGGFSRYNATRPVDVGDSGEPRAVPASRTVQKGSRFGLELSPGAAAGIRSGVPGAATARFFGLLRSASEHPETGSGDGEELLLRVDVVPRPQLSR